MIGYMAQTSMPEARMPSASAVLPLTTICGWVARTTGDAVLEREVFVRPGTAGVEQSDIGSDDGLVLLAEHQRHLLCCKLHVEAVDVAQHAEREHVLAAPRVGHDGAALAFHWDLVHVVAGGDKLVVDFYIGVDDGLVAVVAPHALEQNSGAGLQFAGADAAKQDLFVEGDGQVGFIAAVGDAAGAEADAVAGGAGHAAGGRADFGGDDLHGPDAVAGARGDGAEALAATLRAFAGVADHLDDVFGKRGHRPVAGGWPLQQGDVVHGVISEWER